MNLTLGLIIPVKIFPTALNSDFMYSTSSLNDLISERFSFANLSGFSLEKLVDSAELVSLSQGQALLRSGSFESHVFLLVSGTAASSHFGAGKQS